jgi:2-dehydropantoate 2-reductase
MRILIAGTGALACVYAAQLARLAENDVVMFGSWAEQLDAIEASGITIQRADDAVGEATSIKVCRDADALDAPFDLVVVATKGYQIERRVSDIAHVLDPATVVFGVQNGLTPWATLDRAVAGRACVLAGESMVAATKLEPGVVQLFSLGETLLAPTAGQAVDAATRAAAALEAADLPVRVIEPEQLTKLLWEKAIITAGLNAVSIVLRVPVSGIRRSSAASRITRRAMEEVRDVAATEGVALDVDESFAGVAAFGDNRPSGLQDFLAGRMTEVADINGAVAERSQAAGLSAPCNKLLDEFVTALYETASDRIPETEAMRVPALAQEGARP